MGNSSSSSSSSATPRLAPHSVPDSCCRQDVVGCGHNILQLPTDQVLCPWSLHQNVILYDLQAFRTIHINGCYEIILETMKQNKVLISCVVFGVAALQV